jgi:hypothetical protein
VHLFLCSLDEGEPRVLVFNDKRPALAAEPLKLDC